MRKQFREWWMLIAWGLVAVSIVAGIFYYVSQAQAGSLLFYPKFKAVDVNGNPIVGGLLYTYVPGTATAKATYSDRGLTTANTNPVVLDSYGEATVYLNGLTKLVLKSADAATTYWTMDNVGGGGLDVEGTQVNGYIAVFTSTGVTGYPELSGASIQKESIPSSKLSGNITTVGVSSASPIATSSYNIGMIQWVEMIGTTTYASGVSGQWYSGVTDPPRAKTSGVSLVFRSPTAVGQNAVVVLRNKTSDVANGTTTYVIFTAGDQIDGADAITAGISCYVMSGNTDSQTITVNSTGVSKWFVKTSGSPTVVWQ